MSVSTGAVIGSSIDDADGSLNGFQYFGDWGLGESIPQHYGKTAHYSGIPGSKALLFFRGAYLLTRIYLLGYLITHTSM
jgi:hypothetical protein